MGISYRAKLELDHPDWDTKQLNDYVTINCPDAEPIDNCVGYHEKVCEACWNRDARPIKSGRYPWGSAAEGLIAGFNNPDPELVQAAQKLANAANELGWTIKDSGDRTEFATGAVRDMREGKGRCDLMPLEVVAEYIRRGISNPKNEERYWFFEDIARFQATNNTDFLYCAMAVFEPSAFEYTSTMLLEVAKHFEEGAKKYGENNWQKGIPTYCYIDSAVRHYLKWLDGQTDERHDRAVMWNLMCCIWEVDYSGRGVAKGSKRDIIRRYAKLNAARRQKLNSKG